MALTKEQRADLDRYIKEHYVEPEIINNNRVYYNGIYWVVESADGTWEGYELYDSYIEAECAALRPNE